MCFQGVRALYDGHGGFFSRNGNRFPAPDWFSAGFPKYPLDGELWCGRGEFQQAVSIVRSEKRAADWKFVKYLVFDTPLHPGKFEERLEAIRDAITQEKTPHAVAVGQVKCSGKAHVIAEMRKVIDQGGEGLMLRQPGSRYQHGRSSTLLKVKEFTDAEALVMSHEMGQGRNQFRMGALHCELPNGKQLRVGTGFSDAQRNKPPKKGSIITFKYQELSDEGIPRFPVFLRVREDVTWEEVKKNAAAEPEKKKIKGGLMERKHSLLYTVIDRSKEAAALSAASTSETSTTATPQKNKRTLSIANAMEALSDPSPNKKAKVEAWSVLNNIDTAHDNEGEDSKTKKGKESIKDTNAAAAASGADDTRPLCRYGLQCYRKDPTHFKNFAHPTKPTASGTAAAAAAAPAPVVSPLKEKEEAEGASVEAEEEEEAKTESIVEPIGGGRELRRSSLLQQSVSRSDTLPLMLPLDTGKEGSDAYPFKVLLVPAALYESSASFTSSGIKVPEALGERPASQDEQNMQTITLPDGPTVLGRGKYELTSPHISKAHAELFCDLMGGGLEIEPKGMNEIFIRERTTDDDAPNHGFVRVSKTERRRCFNGDCLALLPDLSHRYYIKIMYTQ
jgi:hypothetical protein